MKLLECLLCGSEVNIVGNEKIINKKIKCTKCDFNNVLEKKETEILIIKKRN